MRDVILRLMPGVFLSYARQDGEARAAALRDRLTREAPDIAIRQDRISLEGGNGLVATGRALRTLEGHSAWVAAVAVTPDGQRAVSASDDNTLRVWDIETGLALATFHCDAPVFCCAFAGRR
jgi:WD40 repeat protein